MQDKFLPQCTISLFLNLQFYNLGILFFSLYYLVFSWLSDFSFCVYILPLLFVPALSLALCVLFCFIVSVCQVGVLRTTPNSTQDLVLTLCSQITPDWLRGNYRSWKLNPHQLCARQMPSPAGLSLTLPVLWEACSLAVMRYLGLGFLSLSLSDFGHQEIQVPIHFICKARPLPAALELWPMFFVWELHPSVTRGC